MRYQADVQDFTRTFDVDLSSIFKKVLSAGYDTVRIDLLPNNRYNMAELVFTDRKDTDITDYSFGIALDGSFVDYHSVTYRDGVVIQRDGELC